MKILKTRPKKLENAGSHRVGGILKFVLSGTGAIICFNIILSLIINFASPSQYVTINDIKQEFNIVESEGGTYFGPMIEAVYSGQGEFQYLEGGTYTGDFADSQRGGKGTFVWQNGDYFEGTWANDQMVEGKYYFSSGSSFTGTFDNLNFGDGTFNMGTICEADGYVYFNVTLSDGTVTDLDFKKVDGLSYFGGIKGQAKITYPTGNQYSGQVINGVRSGEGEFKWKQANETVASFSGNWKDGVMSGSGKYYFSTEAYPYIEGTFVNGRPDGSATYYKEAGNTFETTWSNGKCTKVTES